VKAVRRLHDFFGGSWSILIALAWLVIVIAIGVFAPLVAPLDPNAQDLSNRLRPPLTDGHLLGTDVLGRDVLSRLIYGTRVSLVVGFATVVLSVVLGVAVGLVSGYLGGVVDTVFMRIVDAWLAFPFLLLAIAIVAMLGPGLNNALLAIAIINIPTFGRLMRSRVLSVKQEDFVLAARAMGMTNRRILFRHILPNSWTPIMVQGTLGFATAVIEAAALGFLGLGAQPPQPEWGTMLADARGFIQLAPWTMFFPGLAIMLTVLGFNLLGDGLRDVLDPRMKR